MSVQRVWILSDGISGHVNQAIGITHLLYGDAAQIHKINTQLRAPFLSRPLLHLLYNYLGPKRWVRSITSILYSENIPASRTSSDVVISAGGNTRFLNAAAGDRNIFIGSLRELDGGLFDVSLTMERTNFSSNIVMALPPSRLSPASADAAGEKCLQRMKHWGQPEHSRLWTLLVGGDGAGFRYCEKDWYNLASLIKQLAHQHNIRWFITTSRRTSAFGQQHLKKALSDREVAEASWNGEPQKGTLIEYVGASERVFCTADSMSMLGDSLNAGKPTCALVPLEATPNQRYEDALDNFRDRYALQCWPMDRRDTSNLELPTSKDLRARILRDRDALKKRILAALSDSEGAHSTKQ